MYIFEFNVLIVGTNVGCDVGLSDGATFSYVYH